MKTTKEEIEDYIKNRARKTESSSTKIFDLINDELENQQSADLTKYAERHLLAVKLSKLIKEKGYFDARRSFDVEYKKKILAELTAAPEKTAEVLTREDLKAGNIAAFRKSLSVEGPSAPTERGTDDSFTAVMGHLDRIEAMVGSLSALVNALSEKTSEPQLADVSKYRSSLIRLSRIQRRRSSYGSTHIWDLYVLL